MHPIVRRVGRYGGAFVGGQRDIARCVTLLKQGEGSVQGFFRGLILPIRQFLLHKLLQSGESAGCIVRKLLDAA